MNNRSVPMIFNPADPDLKWSLRRPSNVQAHGFCSYPDPQFLSGGRFRKAVWRIQRKALSGQSHPTVFGPQLGWDEVHRRRADELRDEPIRGQVIDPFRPVNLLQATFMQDRDPVGEAQCLHLIVSDVDNGPAERFVQAPELYPEFQPHSRIEVRQRFIKQQYFGGMRD